MKPRLISILLITIILQCYGQNSKFNNTYVCDNGKIHFFASTPIEDIEAISAKTVCAINADTRRVSAKVQMESFQFRRKKMQDDFNEDYVESTKFPYAILDAVIVEKINFSKDGVYPVTLKGTFEVHGVKKPIEVKGELTVKNGQPFSANAQFDVALADYNIKIPTLVVAKVARVVKVDANFEFRKYQGNI